MYGQDLTVGFVGAGAVGTALSTAWAASGVSVVAIASAVLADAERLAQRMPGASAVADPAAVADRCDLVLLTVPDRAIAEVAAALAARPGQAVVHVAGGAPLAALAVAERRGARVGVFHPLQTFVVDRPVSLRGGTVAIEAEEPLRRQLIALAERLQARPLVLNADDRMLYHASAALASNALVALEVAAAALWSRFGIGQEEALAALRPLVEASIAGLRDPGPPACLTGPVARGDVDTIRAHRAVLERRAPESLPAYLALTRLAVPIARAKGSLSADAAAAVERVLG